MTSDGQRDRGAGSVKAVILLKRDDLGEPVERFRGLLSASTPSMGVEGVRRHVRALTLLGGYRRAQPLYDAVDELYFDDEATARTALGALHDADWPAGARLASFLAIEHLAKQGPKPPGGVKSFEFVLRKPGMSVAEFGRYWREVHGPIAVHVEQISHYVQTHAVTGEYAEGAQPVWDGAAQTWFEDVSAMRRAGESGELAATRADEKNFLAHPLELPMLITSEEELPI